VARVPGQPGRPAPAATWDTKFGDDLPAYSAITQARIRPGGVVIDLGCGTGRAQLARVTRPGGLLILFHPTGRAALAARHGRTLEPDEPLAEPQLQRSTRYIEWQLTAYDDAEHRFLAIATRRTAL
jgi:hypothetical protein